MPAVPHESQLFQSLVPYQIITILCLSSSRHPLFKETKDSFHPVRTKLQVKELTIIPLCWAAIAVTLCDKLLPEPTGLQQ